jgi:hypothetical protein
MSGGRSCPVARSARAVETFQNAALTIGEVKPGMSLFGITRGQFSMIDMALHILDAIGGGATLSVWTWVLVDYEIEFFRRLMDDGRISSGRLIIDASARKNNAMVVAQWEKIFGEGTVRFAMSHAKIVTLAGAGMKFCIRGSMNLNHNPRFEQFDISEGGPAYDLVRSVEDELMSGPYTKDGAEIYAASKLSERFDGSTLKAFKELKSWRK